MRMTVAMLLAIASTITSTAYADLPPEADRLWKEAVELYEKKQYSAAGRKFESVFVVHKVRSALFNAGKSYEKARELDQALRLYDKFLVFGAAEGKSNKRLRLAQAKVKKLKKLLSKVGARITVDVSPSGAQVFLDGNDTPFEGQLDQWLKAGVYSITVKKLGYVTHRRKLYVNVGENARLQIQLEEASVVEPVASAGVTESTESNTEASSGSHVLKSWWFWTAVGAVVTGTAVTAIVLMRDTSGTQSAGKSDWGVWEPASP